MDFLSDLKWRGLIKDVSNESKINKAQLNHRGLYCGFDPTASSLHVGHLIPITMLERARRFGFKPIALIGGGTGMIGDPSFKSQERILLSEEQVDNNVQAIKKQLNHLIPEVNLMNNKAWLGKLNLIDFLRGVGKDFNVTYLLSKEAITKRIATGLSITEFLYPILQAYDFYWLYKNEKCCVEVGGSDQWGNITSGLDFIRSQVGEDSQATGLTVPLLLQKNGEKFGKTANGTPIWLDPELTSPYVFYQFWMNQNDEDALKLLKILTFTTQENLRELIRLNNEDSRRKLLQNALAKSMTFFVHGLKALEEAKALSDAFFYGTVNNLDYNLWTEAIRSLPTTIIDSKNKVIEALLASGIVSSKREAREFVHDKAILINERIVTDLDQLVTEFAGPKANLFLVKKGKRYYFAWEVK